MLAAALLSWQLQTTWVLHLVYERRDHQIACGQKAFIERLGMSLLGLKRE